MIGNGRDEQTLGRIEGRIDVVGRRKRPPLGREQETMIAEVVVAVTDTNVECDAAIEFAKVAFDGCAMLDNKIDQI